MTTQSLSVKCTRCNGAGIDDNLIPPAACQACGGDGYVESALIDSTEVIEKLDYITGKVNAIWAKVKDL